MDVSRWIVMDVQPSGRSSPLTTNGIFDRIGIVVPVLFAILAPGRRLHIDASCHRGVAPLRTPKSGVRELPFRHVVERVRAVMTEHRSSRSDARVERWTACTMMPSSWPATGRQPDGCA